jgi:hypothetical protein
MKRAYFPIKIAHLGNLSKLTETNGGPYFGPLSITSKARRRMRRMMMKKRMR